MPTNKAHAVSVTGLDDFLRELKAMDPKLVKELGQANKEAADVVAKSSVRTATGLGGVAAKAAPSIKAAAQARRSVITLGGPAYPFALGAAFGGQGRPTTQQFKPHLGTQSYFLIKDIRETEDEYMHVYERAIDRVVRAAFPD